MQKFKKSIGIWNPENQKEIIGKVRNITDDVEFKSYKYRQYVLETENAIVSVLGSTVLDKKLESINVQIDKKGEAEDQGNGYLEDGSMVIVNGAADAIDTKIACTIVRLHQTNNGRMIFA